MKVLLDTNILVADFRMKSTNFEVLFYSIEQGFIDVYIPEIVFDETVNKFKERLEEVQTRILSEQKIYEKITEHSFDLPYKKSQIEKDIIKYKEYLTILIKKKKIKKIAYPLVEHDYLANKAIKKVKPFNSNGAGYRDALIWENIKTHITQDQEVLTFPELVFLTKNYKDFSTQDFELHEDLKNELKEECFDQKSIKIYSSLNEFVATESKVRLEQATEIENKLKNGGLPDLDIESICLNYLDEKLLNSDISTREFGISDAIENPTISFIESNFQLDSITAKKISVDSYIVDVDFKVQMTIDAHLLKSEYYVLGDKEQREICVEDSNWNDHYMWVTLQNTPQLSMSIILNTEMEVLNRQINSVNNNYTQQWL